MWRERVPRRPGKPAREPRRGSTSVGVVAVAVRCVDLGVRMIIGACGLIVLTGAARVVGPRATARRDHRLVGTLAGLGPAVVKTMQILSTRADVLPPHTCRALARLHADVRHATRDARGDRARRETAELCRRVATLPARDARPVAAGSIAVVYRATASDGRDLAIKLRRPGVERRLGVDLAIMRAIARIGARLPGLRGVPVIPMVDRITESVYGQLDLGREAERLHRLRDEFGDQPHVCVPEVHTDLSGEDALVMEFVDGLDPGVPERLDGEKRRLAARNALHGMFDMLFGDGLVHCDLHPGNLYVRADGTVIILDAGFMVEMDDEIRERFTAFFHCLSMGNGAAGAEVVLSTATGREHADLDGFRAELKGLIEANSGVRAEQFSLPAFAARLFSLQRRYGLYANPAFVFPILSLLVLEGTVRHLAPDIDFQHEAKPFLVRALLERNIARTAGS